MARNKIERPQKGEVYDYTDRRLTASEWASYVQQQTKIMKKTMRKHAMDNHVDTLEIYDFTDVMEKRRAAAMRNSISELYEKYDDPAYAPSSVGWSWVDLNLGGNTYSFLDNDYHLLYAASIWILEQLRRAENSAELFEQLYPLLTEFPDDLDSISAPNAWDCFFDEDLIKSVAYVLLCRNDFELAGYYGRSFTSEALASGKIDHESDDRKNYDALIRLIPQEVIDAACAHFRERFSAWTELFFKALDPSMRRSKLLRNRIVSNQKKYNEVVDKICSEIELYEKEQKNVSKKPPVVLNLTNGYPAASPAMPSQSDLTSFLGRFNGSPSSFDLSTPEARIREMSGRLSKLEVRVNEDIDALNDLVRRSRSYYACMFLDGYVKPENQEVLTDIGFNDSMEPLSIKDPYELCFALLYLTEAGDDLPWLYGAGCGLMATVAAALPWAVSRYTTKKDPVWSDGAKPEAPLPGTVKLPDFYGRTYRSKNKKKPVPRNLAQIVYEATGCVLPQDMLLYAPAAKKLSSYGIRGNDAASLLSLMSVLGSVKHRYEAKNLVGAPDDEYFDDETDEEDLEAEAGRKLCEKDDFAALKRENKRLRAYLHDYEKTSKESRAELEQIRKTAQQEHRELADLREYVFHLDTDQEPEEPDVVVDTEKWPYTVRRNTLVFGGHATWAKGIKSILNGNIRFVDKNLTFDTSILRNAEVIWIQPNALSHPYYWRVVDTARSLGIPVRYFTYASWVKCAEQVVAGDI